MSQPGMCSLLGKKRDSTLIRHVGLHVQIGIPQYILCWLGGPYPEVRCALQEPWARSPGTYANDHCHRFPQSESGGKTNISKSAVVSF